MWQRSTEVGREADTKCDLGRAYLELGRHLTPDDPDRLRHLDEAMRIARLGARWELDRVSRVGGFQVDRGTTLESMIWVQKPAGGLPYHR